MDQNALNEIAMSVRCLSMDAIQRANSGHPGLPLGCAELGALLYGEFMRHDPSAPAWLDRDRFVLSAGHGSMFLYSLLHMAGYGISVDDIMSFRQIGSKCAGHPEYGLAPGIETTTGPLGQGVANAVGMAIAETMLAARFNTPGHTIIDHYTWALAGDGCMQEGVTSEAVSLAGHLGLGKLIVFYDDNRITIDGATNLSFSEDVGARFAAAGWQVQRGDMYDADGIRAMVAHAKADSAKPSLVILQSVIGKGAPTMQGSHKVHGAPLGTEEIARAKEAMGIPADAQFWVSPKAIEFFKARRIELAAEHAEWERTFSAWKDAHPALAIELDAAIAGKSSRAVEWPSYKSQDTLATRAASGKALAAVANAWPQLVGGSADLTGPNLTQLPGPAYSRSNRSGRMMHYGIREHAMAAISNGIALHGGLKPFCATFLVFADYLRPALRLSALMGLPVIYVLTHDSIFVGEDGPTHQPVEHLAVLRAIPNVVVLRPADAEETNEAWSWAMKRRDGPTVIALSRQNLPVLSKADPDWRETIRTGAYVVRNSRDEPDVVVLASGSEVELALHAADLVPGKSVRVVSVLSRETFLGQPEPIRRAMIPNGCRVVACEAGRSLGWERIADVFLGIERFGESGPGAQVAAHLGLTVEALAGLIAGGSF
ncbi:MAG: transketolase [Spirochaetales bacterium]|nr:MAG: transketolase [Spirochaetales bacterium]